MDVDNVANRANLAYTLGKLMDLNIEATTGLLKKFKAIESNRELINSLPEILEDYF